MVFGVFGARSAFGAVSGFALTVLAVAVVMTLSGCAITATRPVQEMANSAAAIKAAKEVQADVLAPEIFRQSTELFFKAKRAYKFKEYKDAKELAFRARVTAEEAELESVLNGGNRQSLDKDPLSETKTPPESDPTATPTEP